MNRLPGMPDELASRLLWPCMQNHRWIAPPTSPAEPVPPESCDALFCDARTLSESTLQELLIPYLPHLRINGALFLCLSPPQVLSDAFWQCLGLLAYEFYEVTWNSEPWRVAMAVRSNYNPVQHARDLLQQGNPVWGLDVLLRIPQRLLVTEEAKGLVSAEKLLCLLARDKRMGEDGRLNRFARALNEFYLATTWLPRLQQPYQCLALFWDRLGRPDMARRTLHSILHVECDAQSREILNSLSEAPKTNAEEVQISITTGIPPLRLLYLMPPGPDYGNDVLYHGLCLVLGDDHVIDYPWKPTLHGDIPREHRDYPCLFNHPGTPLSLPEITVQLREHRFDAILMSDVLGALPPEELHAIANAAPNIPIVIVDMWDQCGDYRSEMETRLGVAARMQFKREMLMGAAYSPNTHPLPFAYPDERIPVPISFEHRQGLFWAGNPQYGMRRLTLEWLEQRFGFPWNAQYTQAEYVIALQNAAIGLCLSGNGFDTVRYWEIPAHGAMLLAERPPIHLPNNFRDGESAVFFDSLPDLEDKLTFYLSHPERISAIAEQGHRHLKAHHTASARARQFLHGLSSLLFQ